jgi:DNA helicase II / ATP-dependent DNA helicase PcrA
MHTQDFSKLTPYELGETKDSNAIPFLLTFLKAGDNSEKRLAASAISKLAPIFPNECRIALPHLIGNLSSEMPQIRQYTLKAIKSLSLDKSNITQNDLGIIQYIEAHDPKDYNISIAQVINKKWTRLLGEKNEFVNQVTRDTEKQKPKFGPYPVSASKKVIVKAEIADTKTTRELVSEDERDAYYFRSLEGMGIKLNEPQLHAVRHYKGPALVLAGAGSGKTRVLASRAGYLISIHHVEPKHILLLTFTKKAAEEMNERISALPGLSKRLVPEITSGTYHSIFLKILKSQGDNRKILSSDKHKHTYLQIIMKEMGVGDEYEPESLIAILSHYKNNMISAEAILAQTSIEKEVKEILQKYEAKKKENGFMDFDDILLDSYLLLKKNSGLLTMIQSRFQFVLCDEWQDTNPIQYELIKMISLPQNNLFVVGDDDQTIFEFTGADSSIILNFPKEYLNTKTYHLNINYRSTTSIVGLANKIISFNKNRYKKTLQATKESEYHPFFTRPKTSDEEAEMIVKNIANDVKQGNRNYRDYSILFRTSSYSRAVFEQLVLQDIPFVTFGNSTTFYEQSIVKPVIDHLRLAVDGNNLDAVNGVLPTLYLNREKTIEFIQRRDISNSANNLLIHAVEIPYLKEFQKNQIFARIRLLKEIKTKKPLEAIKAVRKEYEKYLNTSERKNITVHKEMINETLAEIESSAARFVSIAEFLAFIEVLIEKNKRMEELRKDPKADVVKLMSIHKSKGLEFPVVYLIGASETILPHKSALEADGRKDLILTKQAANKIDLAIEGERRLAYVAITRAEEEVYISSPSEYKGQEVEISRYIMEVFSEPKAVNKGLERKLDSQQIIKRRNINRENMPPTNSRRVVESTLGWECMTISCKAWKRMGSYEELQLERIHCIVCGGEMEKAVKEIYQ